MDFNKLYCIVLYYRDESGWTTLKRSSIRILDAFDKYDKKQLTADQDVIEVVTSVEVPRVDSKKRKQKAVVCKPVVIGKKSEEWSENDSDYGVGRNKSSRTQTNQDPKMAKEGPGSEVSLD